MEFKSLKNIESSFKQIRFIVLACICLCAGITLYTLYSSYQFAELQRQKVYVLDQGKSLILALSQLAEQNRPVEAREHIKRFHELFFTLSPDRDAIEGNIRRALNLANQSAYNYYRDLNEQGYYNRLISGNIQQQVEIDSININFNIYPYPVTTYSRQFIIRETITTERSLITSCILQNAVKSDLNPQGFMIENFLVTQNEDIKTIKR